MDSAAEQVSVPETPHDLCRVEIVVAHAAMSPLPVNPTLHVHAVAAVLALGEFALPGHATQAAEVVAPGVPRYFPAPQFTHAAAALAPDVTEYVPAGHATHAAAELAPCVVKYVPAPQSTHAALPVPPLYFPAAQEVHVPPSGPVDPTLQEQAVAAVLATGEFALPGHAAHAASSVAPDTAKYFPAPQPAHALAPAVAEYVPTAHETHAAEELAPVCTEYVPAGHAAHGLAPDEAL